MHKQLFFLLILLLPNQLAYHWWPEWSYLYGLRRDYLAPTLYLTDLIIFLIFIFYLQNLKSQSASWRTNLKTKSQNLKLLVGFLIFVFLFVSCLLAQNQAVAFLKLLKILELLFLGYYVAKNHNSQFVIRNWLIFSVVYSSVIAVGQFLKQSSLGGVLWWMGERSFTAATPGIAKIELAGQVFLRSYGTFSHPNSLAGFLLVGLILTLPLLWRRSNRLTMSYVLLTVSAITLTFSRPVGLVVGLLPLFFWGGLAPESFTRREELAQTAIQLIKAKPLLGVGLNNFLLRLPFTNFVQPVHNIYLLIASETGVIIFIAFIIFIIKTLIRAIKNWSLVIALLVILFTGLFDHYWLTLQQNQLLFALVLGLCWQKRSNLR